MKDKFNPVQRKRLRELAGLITEGTIPVRGYVGKRGLPRRTYGQGQQHLPAWDEPRPKKSKVPEPPKEYVDTKEDIYPEVVKDIRKITVPIRIERGKLVKAPEMSPEDKAYLELAIDTTGVTTGDYLYTCKGWRNVQKALEAEPRLEKAMDRQCEYQADSEWNPEIIEPVWFFKQNAWGSLFEGRTFNPEQKQRLQRLVGILN